jgi:hypothetical protein
MTSHHSSISSSDLRRYLCIAVVVFLGAIGALLTLSGIGYGLGLVDASNRSVLDYQLDKVDQAGRVDIIFVGDSSLGNAINAKLFSSLSGAKTLNLALSGTYGVGASYNMIRQSFEVNHPRVAIVMQSLKTMKRPEAAAGYFFTTDHPDWADLSPVELAKVYLSYRAASETLSEIRRNGLTRLATTIEGDYIAQQIRDPNRLKPVAEAAQEPLLPGMISREQLRFIKRIGEYCKAQGITCLYASGPIYDGYCKTAAYRTALDNAIEAAGVTVVKGTPFCVPIDQLGDAVDHVAPSLKEEYTRRYYAALAPYLTGTPIAAAEGSKPVN